MRKTTLLLLPIFLLLTCQKPLDPALKDAKYLHIAHTRSYGESKDKVMKAVEELDYSPFDVLMLGGDLAYESSGSIETLKYLDSIFDLKNPKTLWSLGNHDYRDHPELIPEITGRPNFYTFHENGITFLNFDSQADSCNTSGAQLELFKNVTDTLNETRTLILLHHKLIWMLDHGDMQKQLDEVANGGFGGCFFCTQPNNFYREVYPKLAKLKKKGIQIICLAGDIGAKVKEYEYVNSDGIVFLASGLKDGSSSNKALIFRHNSEDGKLKWKYEFLSELPKR